MISQPIFLSVVAVDFQLILHPASPPSCVAAAPDVFVALLPISICDSKKINQFLLRHAHDSQKQPHSTVEQICESLFGAVVKMWRDTIRSLFQQPPHTHSFWPSSGTYWKLEDCSAVLFVRPASATDVLSPPRMNGPNGAPKQLAQTKNVYLKKPCMSQTFIFKWVWAAQGAG